MIIFHWIKTRIKLIKKHLGDPFSTGCLCQADVVKTLKVELQNFSVLLAPEVLSEDL